MLGLPIHSSANFVYTSVSSGQQDRWYGSQYGHLVESVQIYELSVEYPTPSKQIPDEVYLERMIWGKYSNFWVTLLAATASLGSLP